MKTHRYLTAVLALGLLVSGSSLPAAEQQAPALEIEGRDSRGVPNLVTGRLGAVAIAELETQGTLFLESFARDVLGGRGDESFSARRVLQDGLGKTHLRASQTIDGRPVVGAELILQADTETGEVTRVSGYFVPDVELPRAPRLGAQSALDLAYGELGIVAPRALSEPELVYVLARKTLEPTLAWSLFVEYQRDGEVEVDRLFADAVEGGLAARHPQIQPVRDRRTFDAQNTTTTPEDPVMIETDVSGTDLETWLTHAHAGLTYSYYDLIHGRDSWDANGGVIDSVVHWGNGSNRAFWNQNDNRMRFGDGDGVEFGPFGVCLEIVAHEFTHGVTSEESQLVYQDESGALNESLSDIFGAAAEAWFFGGSSNPWMLGERCTTPAVPGDALRYMNDPALDGDSRDHFLDRYTGTADSGGVHYNSGISNLAFFLMSEGGWHPRGKALHPVTGIGMASAEDIFYRAQLAYLWPNADFEYAADFTVLAARDLFGPNSAEVEATRRAWCAVGVSDPECPIELTINPTVLFGQFIVGLQWKFGTSDDVDVFHNGTLFYTGPNTGSASQFLPLSSTGTQSYWVCPAGSTQFYDPDICSNLASFEAEF